MVVDDEDVDICLKDPGYEVEATISADLLTFVRVLLGREPLARALRAGAIRLDGPRDIVRQLPAWLHLDGRAMTSLGIAR